MVRLFGAIALAFAVGVVAVLLPSAALAADGAVLIPWGDYAIELAHIVGAVAVALLPVVLAFLPAPVRLAIAATGGERLVRNAVDYGINAVEGAAKDKVLSVAVGNAVLEEALEYALREGAPWLIRILGGPDGIRAKLFRLLNLEAEASAAKLGILPR
jgi:hypothetical protein